MALPFLLISKCSYNSNYIKELKVYLPAMVLQYSQFSHPEDWRIQSSKSVIMEITGWDGKEDSVLIS